VRQEDGCDNGQSRIHSIPNLFVREVLLGVFKTIHRRSGSGGGDPDEVNLQACEGGNGPIGQASFIALTACYAQAVILSGGGHLQRG